MPLVALIEWRTTRSDRLDELLLAHSAIGGTARGRRWRTQQLNWAITLRLAGEFQGFSRDLHTLAADQFAAWASGGNTAADRVIATVLTTNRQLDRGNAQPSSLGSDFGRFGIDLWTALAGRNALTSARQRNLELLNEARNGIAHSQPAKLQALQQAGFPISLSTIRRWRRSLGALASTMDEVMADHLAQLFGRGRPW